jgi:hypothetical protein
MTATMAGPAGDSGWTARSRAWVAADGFFPAEFDPTSRRSFSWTGRTAHLVLPHLDRSQVNRLTLKLRAGRSPASAPLPVLWLMVDHVVLVTTQTSNEQQAVSVDIPRRRAAGAIVTLMVSNTFTPGVHDTRALGVIVDDVSLTAATGHFRPSGYVMARAASGTPAARHCCAPSRGCSRRHP